MNFSDGVFKQYFDNRISQEELLNKIGSNEPEFEEYLKRNLEDVLLRENAKRLEYLIYVVMLTEDKIDIQQFIDLLNKLLICDWHEQHENIAMILEKTHSPLSVEYLEQAIYLRPQYLSWDDNFAFEIKCIWALGYIKNKEAKKVLEKISLDLNETLSQNAKYQLRKYSE